jgi:parvulin-like peptidyl-prolyl isomerase
MKPRLIRILCLTASFYLIGDAFIFDGPVRHWLQARLAPQTEHLAARVGGRPITRSQLDRALAERLWCEGKSATALTADELQATRSAALDELIDDALLDLQVKALPTQLAVDDAAINERLARLLGRFETKDSMEAAMKSQGIVDEAALRARIAAQIRREKMVELRLTSLTRTSEDEARQWFETHAEASSQPERIEVRHIFIPTLDHPSDEAKQKLTAVLGELTAGTKDFATLAKEHSLDPATKDLGGNLGWMSRDRLPADFAATVFTMELAKPELLHTKLGWHLVEVTARKSSEPRTFEQAKPEILAALDAFKRQDATATVRKSLRSTAANQIEVFP